MEKCEGGYKAYCTLVSNELNPEVCPSIITQDKLATEIHSSNAAGYKKKLHLC